MNDLARYTAPAGLLFALTACGEPMPLQELFTSDLRGDALADAYSARLNRLSADPEDFVAELEATGFASHDIGREYFFVEESPYHCATWEFSRAEPPLWASVNACHNWAAGKVELRRRGIGRESRTADYFAQGEE